MSAHTSSATITVYADFNCPWSYLTWRRSEILAAARVEVDWRAVEHDPWHHLGPVDLSDRFQTTHAEMGKVGQHLLPGEPLPHVFAGHVPFTGAATAAYAEATVAGVASPARRVLFEAFWLNGVDLNDGRTVRALLSDLVRGRASTSELIHLWGYTVDVTGGPITSEGWRLVRDWRADWQRLGPPVVPTLILDAGEVVRGEEAVDRLAAELTSRGLDDVDSWDALGFDGAAAGAA